MENTADLKWRTSSYSSNGGGECVAVANTDVVHVMDTKDSEGPRLEITPDGWHSFVSKIKRSN